MLWSVPWCTVAMGFGLGIVLRRAPSACPGAWSRSRLLLALLAALIQVADAVVGGNGGQVTTLATTNALSLAIGFFGGVVAGGNPPIKRVERGYGEDAVRVGLRKMLAQTLAFGEARSAYAVAKDAGIPAMEKPVRMRLSLKLKA